MVEEKETFKIQLASSNHIKIPECIVRKWKLLPNDFFDLEEKDDGFFLRPLYHIKEGQSWYWSPSWRTMTRKAEDDIKYKRIEVFKDAQSAIKFLTIERSPGEGIQGRIKLKENKSTIKQLNSKLKNFGF